MSRFIETNNGAGAHDRRHDEGDLAATVETAYMPCAVSIEALIQKTKSLLIEEDGKTEGLKF